MKEKNKKFAHTARRFEPGQRQIAKQEGYRGMRGVALLPKKLEGADEGARPHLPSVHVSPLVQQQRQVAVGLNPLRKHVVHDRLRCRPHHQRLFEILASPYEGLAFKTGHCRSTGF